MNRRIVILGSGVAGTLAANRLRRHYDESEFGIVVVDKDDDHLCRPALVSVPFGLAEPSRIVRLASRQLADGIGFRKAEADRVDLDTDTVHFTDGSSYRYDVLVLATGAAPTPGPSAAGVLPFHDLPSAVALRDALRRFDGGRLVVDIAGTAAGTPVEPLEFCFLADWYFRRRKIRDRVELACVTPLNGAGSRPEASRALGQLLEEKWIRMTPRFTTSVIDGENGRLLTDEGHEIPFDLAVVFPQLRGAPWLVRSPGLADGRGFVTVDRHTLQCKSKPNVFALGDAAGLPVPRSTSAVSSQAGTLVHNIRRFLADEPLDASYDGHAACRVETGFGRALLLDSTYDTEARPGLESRLVHAGARAAQRLYWSAVLPGRPHRVRLARTGDHRPLGAGATSP